MQAAMSVAAKDDQIREAAYHIWEASGRPIGQAEQHWEMAKQMVEQPKPRQAAPKAAFKSAVRTARAATTIKSTRRAAKSS